MKCALIALVLLLGSAPAVPSATGPSAPERSPGCASHFRLVARIDIEREIQEGPYREQWDELERALREEGFEIGLVRQEERRYSSDAWEAVDAVLRVSSEIAETATFVLVIAGLVGKKLKGRVRLGPRRGEKRLVQIVGPDGKTLREVEVPDEE